MAADGRSTWPSWSSWSETLSEADEALKRELAPRDWPYVEDYVDAKTGFVEGIIARASAARSSADPD